MVYNHLEYLEDKEDDEEIMGNEEKLRLERIKIEKCEG